MKEVICAALAAASIPSALFGFVLWLVQRRIDRRDKLREAREEKRRKDEAQKEKDREDFEFLLVQGTGAAIALGEATAKAVQRIPDAHCNGDMKTALDYATQVKHQQKEFLAKQGVAALFD